MNIQSAFFALLFFLYLLQDIGLSQLYKKQYHKSDDFIGKHAPDEVQRYFGKSMYLVLGYYLLAFIYVVTGFTLWGLISEVSILSKPAVQLTGFVLGLVCLLLMTLARLNLGASWRVGLDHATTDALITTGFYRYSRNPYFTFLLVFEGVLILISPNALMICALIQSALLLGLQVRQEEIFLEQKYGEAYQEYKKKTGRFFPKIT
jgi:protein-S-isoprenylcysteine O-methyltransferase Ste14